MAFMGFASRTEVMEAVVSMGDWQGMGYELTVETQGLGRLSRHIIVVLGPPDEGDDGWMDRELMLMELASLRARFRNVSYRVITSEGSKKDAVHP